MKKFLLGTFAFLLVIAFLSTCFLFLTDAGYQLRRIAAESVLSSQHRQLAKYTFLPKEELDAILKQIENPEYLNSHTGGGSGLQTGQKAEDELYVKIETIQNKVNSTHYYEGKVMTISNPHRVKLISSALEDHGEQIFVIAERAKALAAVNASGFVDLEGHGNGGAATGVVIENGVIKNRNPESKDFVMGITDAGKVMTGKYSANELIRFGVTQAAGFRPQLIVNGVKMITSGDGGWGIGPRTAMGQKANGDIVFVVIDGRQSHSIGATIKEVQDLLYERGVINAMLMDGGSSSSMFFNGENITTPSSRNNVPRYLPNIWAVVPERGDKLQIEYDGNQITEFVNIEE